MDPNYRCNGSIEGGPGGGIATACDKVV